MKLKAFVGTATLAAFGFVLCASAPASAKGGGPKPKTTTPKTTTHGKPAGSVAPKGGAATGGAAHGPQGGHVSGASAKPPKGTAPAPHGSGSGAASGKHAEKGPRAPQGTATTSGAAGGTGGLNHAQQLLTQNTNLREKMQSRLPAGMDAVTSASDFRNLGQFVAAVNASHNQGYDFLQLKALMTGPDALSLGQAKKQLRAAGSGSPGPDPVPFGAPPAGSPGADTVGGHSGAGSPGAGGGSPGADTVGGTATSPGTSATSVPSTKTKGRTKSHH